ncbi:hypothetical protein [Stenotrophomonas sp. S39]|uniref:hypothetical protein n=1 Tax=Stenotrophomonas sp. S39 TaxID=2767451 RepID=UPI00190A08B0|nr:hypothetical protein [Stenotrophomonas sp. S39]MBK0052764.1 hypothetical protein [Stenotrophomonas sp. S39]
MSIVSLDQKNTRIQFGAFEVDNRILFEFFNKLAAVDRDEQLHKALYIGVLALMEDRLSSFLSRTANELGTELESLKLIFDMKKELFIVCHLAGDSGKRIVIECKFDKSIRLGDIQSKDVFTKKVDTAWSQLLEAQANRDAQVGIIVFDTSLIDNSILTAVQDLKFLPNIGLIAIIDSQKGDYRNLAIAYTLARDIALNAQTLDLDTDVLRIIVNRLIKDARDMALVKHLVTANIDNMKQILAQIEKGILLAEFNQRYLIKFLAEGTLTKEDMLAFYAGEDVKERFRLVEREIGDLCT